MLVYLSGLSLGFLGYRPLTKNILVVKMCAHDGPGVFRHPGIDFRSTSPLTCMKQLLKIKDVLSLPGPGCCPLVLETVLHSDGQQGAPPATPPLCKRCRLSSLLPSSGQTTEKH